MRLGGEDFDRIDLFKKSLQDCETYDNIRVSRNNHITNQRRIAEINQK